MLINYHDQQIVLRKTRNLELCLGTNMGTTKQKLRKSRFLELFQVSSDPWVFWSVPYDGKLTRATCGEQRDPCARAPSKCWGTCGCACGISQHVTVANARAEVGARMHNWSIWCQGSSRTIGCVMAHSRTRPARGRLTKQSSTCGGGNLDSSVHSARFLAFLW